ncbi:terminase small subunit [Draconibacterium sp. IB214405]|uniref:terminase small subunit n=1 Tax=Draconibacterium sp. IB214405 TaxID=3097352 RepID=UPI002A162989|nr:terminase small subunit [Draconibacterium sp. IB214405]MDX8341176.1 terminase small subunit [Draconibacterium sp. IB214405]
MQLTVKQENFAQLVAAGSTYAAAYQEAYDVKTASKNNIYVKSSQLMDRDKIRIRVEHLQEESLRRNQVNLDEVLTEMSRWIRFDIRDLFNSDNTLKNIDKLSEDVRKNVASFEVLECYEGSGKNRKLVGFLKKVKLHDKTKVADMFMKKFGAYITKLKMEEEDLSHLEDLLNSIKS